MISDVIEKISGAVVQHGKFNDRIYLMKIGSADLDELAVCLLGKMDAEGYSKIFAKIPSDKAEPFMKRGFRVEARISNFYSGREDAVFLGFYSDSNRSCCDEEEKLNYILSQARCSGKTIPNVPKQLIDKSYRICDVADAELMAQIYGRVFPSYPFPVDDPAYIVKTMGENFTYFCAEMDGRIVALASAEYDVDSKNVEMTDFATVPECRGRGLAGGLLTVMELAVMSKGMCTMYTICRAASLAMNRTFASNNYIYAGRLINNTNISGRIDSMNVWYKHIQ